MYLANQLKLRETTGFEYSLSIQNTGQQLTNAAFIELLTTSAPFRLFYNDLLRSAPFPAFYWEHPLLSQEALGETYTFALLPSSSLERKQVDRRRFAPYFTGEHPVVVFDSLGKDARLIVPDGMYISADLVSLANVVRLDDAAVIHSLWRTVGEELGRMLTVRPVYLNTAGDGVSWCHVRLDTRPKYYKLTKYR